MVIFLLLIILRSTQVSNYDVINPFCLHFCRGSGDENEIPVQVSKQITPFQLVLVVQALKPERLVSAMETFVIKTLNLRELSPPALSLKHLFSETMASEPILIIISSGSDPSEELIDLAVRLVIITFMSD